MFAHRILGSPQGKHCNLLEGNVWRKVIPTTKRTILERDGCFFAAVLSLTCLNACAMCVVNLTSRNGIEFRKTNYKLPRNNSTKPYQSYGRVLSLPLSFLWLGYTTERWKSA